MWPDPGGGRSSRIDLTEGAEARLPGAIAVLLLGSWEALCGFAEEEVGVFVGMLGRVIGSLMGWLGVDVETTLGMHERV